MESKSKKIIELKDYKVCSFGKGASNKIFELTKIKKCKFCSTKLDPNKADFYKHSSGWQTSVIKEKVWIWFTCPNCRHQWSINHLGVSKKNIIQL